MRRAALRAATIALLATAASVVTPHRGLAQDITCEPGDLEVRGLEFRGNMAVSDDDLALRITTTPSAWGRRHLGLWFSAKRCLNHIELARDLLRLKAYYRDRGFYSAQVDTVVTPINGRSVRVTFDIKEGSPLRLTSYLVTGLEGIRDSADIMRKLQLKVGQPFDILIYGADMDSIVRRLRDDGYFRATTVPGYDWDTSGVPSAQAMITVVPGKRARFDTATIKVDPVSPTRGQQINDNVVRRLLGIQRGDWYSDRAVTQGQRNLFQLGAYQHIDVSPLPDSLQPNDTLVVLAVQLTEDYMRQVDSEFGWATLDCGRVRMQYTDKNIFGTARRLELTGQTSKLGYGEPVATPFTRDLCDLYGRSPLAKDSAFSSKMYYFTGLTLRQPRLLGTRWVPSLSVYSERRGEYKAYLRTTQVGGELSATRELGDRMPLRLAYNFEYGRTEADPPALCVLFNRCDLVSQQQIEDSLAPLGVASVALARLRTDNAISPTQGHLLRGEFRTSASKLLGTSDSLFFNKATGDVAWYRVLGWRNVLALRLRAGVVLGRSLGFGDPTGFVPPQERLYAGGPTSVRGFQQNELGSAVYIARNTDVRIDTMVVAPADTTYHFSLKGDIQGVFDTDSAPDRSVPLGGNSLLVANIEYRIRDPFFFPDQLQYTLFLDGGDVWTRSTIQGGVPVGRAGRMKWTPGVAIRALTAVGPIQLNIGFNGYQREPGAIYFNPNVTVLGCASPDNTLTYTRNAATGVFEATTNAACPETYQPPKRNRWYQLLTFTFSIGPDF